MNYIKIFPVVAVMLGLIVLSACEVNDAEEDKLEQELRFFNLYRGGNYPNVTQHSSGIYYLEHKAGTGISPDSDDWVLVNHVAYKIPMDEVFESYIYDVAVDNQFDEEGVLYGPYKLQNGTRNKGLEEGLKLMKEGGQATIFFTSELGYGTEGQGRVSPYESLKYEIELLEVIKDIEQYEADKIANYVDTITNADTIYHAETESFMYYIIDQASDGSQVATDSVVEIAYTGYLMDGRIFDSRDADDPFELTVGKDVITGWDLGLVKLKVGEKARLVIPYPLAYGEAGRSTQNSGLRTIPPYETLLFEIEVLSQKAGTPSSDS
jgi:FKBP-type peptidyl-prolyl cis-trans isomerase